MKRAVFDFFICLSILLAGSTYCFGQLVLINKDISLQSCTSIGNSVFEKRGDDLKVKISKGQGGEGVRFSGNWDLQLYDQMEVSLVNYSNIPLKIAVRLENRDMNLKAFKNFFRDYVLIQPNETKVMVMDIPRKRFYPKVEEKLFGMHINPYGTFGDRYHPARLIDLDPEHVTAISFYVESSYNEIEWGIRQVKMINNSRYDIPVWMTLSDDNFFPFVDMYGQFKFKNWPGKVYSDEDLHVNLEKEKDDLNSHPGPNSWSQYGGWKKGPHQEAKGYFYVKKIDEKWWMVDPDGYLFWSHGVVRVTPSCGITPLDNRKLYFENLPAENDTEYGLFYLLHDELLQPYYTKRGIKETYNFSAANIKRKYGDNWQDDYAEICHKRLKSWGLNTIANSSDKYIFMMGKTPYCDRFEIKSPSIEGSANTGWWWDFRDPFHPEFKANVKKSLLERKDEIKDPWCYGFFVDNELNWGSDYALALWTMKSPASQPAKKELVKFLKSKYKTINDLNQKWKSSYRDWNDLLSREEEPGKDAYSDCKEFSLFVIDAYFRFFSV